MASSIVLFKNVPANALWNGPGELFLPHLWQWTILYINQRKQPSCVMLEPSCLLCKYFPELKACFSMFWNTRESNVCLWTHRVILKHLAPDFFFFFFFSTGSRRTGFSSCGSRTLERRLSSCGIWAQLLCSTWDPPGPGLEPVYPALAGGFSTTAPPGKPRISWGKPLPVQ